MDTTKESPTLLSLCTGYGGLDEGISQCVGSLNVLAYSEIEAYACANLCRLMEEQKIPVAPIWTDLKTFPSRPFRNRVDILCGGYPCQPFSAAGRRLGEEDPRHLWPYILELIIQIMPQVCFLENVDGHISKGLYEVLRDLEENGYYTAWGVFSAKEIGFIHERKRVYILAHAKSKRSQRGKNKDEIQSEREWGWVQQLPKIKQSMVWGETEGRIRDARTTGFCSEPLLDRRVDGVEYRPDRTRLLGNGVVPQTAALAWKTLWKEITTLRKEFYEY